MNLDVRFNGLNRVNELIDQAELQVSELHTTTARLRTALMELGIEVSQPTIDPSAD